MFFGHHFKTNVKQGYFSGGAGYTLSKEALRRFGEKASNASICRLNGGAEDVALGKCMQNLGVKAGNSTDVFDNQNKHLSQVNTCGQPTEILDTRVLDFSRRNLCKQWPPQTTTDTLYYHDIET